MIKNTKIFIYNSLLLITVFCIYSCQLDNYDAPNATLKGRLIDIETKELMPTQYQNGAKVRLYEYYKGELSTQPNDFWVKQNGEFENKAIFAGKYRVEVEGAFSKIDPIEMEIKGTKDFEVKVSPYLRLSIEAKQQGDGVSLSTVLSRSVNAPKIQTLIFLCAETPYVDKSTFLKKIDKDLLSVEDKDIVGMLYTEAFKELKSGSTYYVRVGALAENAANDFNYSKVLEVKIP